MFPCVPLLFNQALSTKHLRFDLVLRKGVRNQYCAAPSGPFGYWFLTPFLSPLSEHDAWLSHEPDHIIAEKHGGLTIDDNLAWACFDCNRHKGSDIASRDATTGSLAPLFDPRSQSWRDHFELSEGRIVGLTEIGRVTERLLKFNLAARIEIRRLLIQVSRYPG